LTVAPVRFLGTKQSAPQPESCDLCGAALGEEHDHLVDLEARGLRCACRPCALLFERPGAAGGRYRLVPTSVRRERGLNLTAAEWEALDIPVGMAFFFIDSQVRRWVAFYPSPGGATESVLPLDAWADVLEANPAVAALEPDVEALLVRAAGGGFEGYLVPVDLCYELVGLIRLLWRGFDGGQEVHEAIEGYFATLADKAVTVT
jgi:hypothetical protein